MNASIVALALMALSAQGTEEPLELSLFRTRGAAGLTAVDAVAEIDPAGLFGSDRCAYHVEVAVIDSAGEQIVRDRWRRTTDCEVFRADPEARIVDTFSFAVPSGRFGVEMIVTPGSGNEARSVRANVRGLEGGALASDLYLARQVGWIDTAGAAGWALRKGQLGIAVEAEVEVPTNRPFVAYYLELYRPDRPLVNGVVQGRIRRSDGHALAEFALQRIDTLEMDRPVAGTASLAGLPAGRYHMDVIVRFEGEPELVRSHRFTVIGVEAPLTARGDEDAGAAEIREYFERLSETELSRFDAVTLWIESEEGRRSLEALSPEGRRRFLTEFFRRSAFPLPDGGTATGADALRLFLERSRVVEREFAVRTGQATRPAWQTDRGRLVMLRGMPQDRIQRPMPGGDTRPYEIWYFNIGSGYVYLFADESGFGHYRMLYTTDPSMATLPDWARRVGPAAVSELNTYYGIRR